MSRVFTMKFIVVLLATIAFSATSRAEDAAPATPEPSSAVKDALSDLPALDETPSAATPSAPSEAPAATPETKSETKSETQPEAQQAAPVDSQQAAPAEPQPAAKAEVKTEAAPPAGAQKAELKPEESAANAVPKDQIVVDPNDDKFSDDPGNQTAAIKDSKALDESGLSNPGGKNEFKRPLLFAPEDNGLKLEYPQIKWELDQGTRINLGGLRIQQNQIGLFIDQSNRRETRGAFRRSSGGADLVNNISFAWPELMTPTGVLTLESSDKKIRWRQEVTAEKREDWSRILRKREGNELSLHAKSQWGLLDFGGGLFKVLKAGGDFRMCLTKKSSKKEIMRVCSGYVHVTASGDKLKATPVLAKADANVFVSNKPLGQRGLLNFPPGKPVRMRVTFENGSKVEMASLPVKLSLLDVVESSDGREIILTGRNAQPLGKKKIISKPETHFWSATGIQQDVIWQIAIPKEAPTVRVLGAFNLPFTFVFNYDKIPKESDRVYIREKASTGAYSDTPLLYGYSPNNDQISSKQRRAINTGPNRFEWTFSSPKKGYRNRARLLVKGRSDDARTWVAHHILFRGFSYEASSRLTGVLSATGQNVLLGEIAGNAWFESLGFTQNDIISRQRWGLAARYFRALTSIETSKTKKITDFTVANVDAKYNLVRGVWNRDELFGLIGSLQNASINNTGGLMSGFGGYWARTMPKIFADIFNLIPYLDYAKYVDVELIFYPVSLTQGLSTGTTSALNFHGKVFWTRRIYGEMGFGIRRYDFRDTNKNTAVAIATAYGNVGLGVVF